MVQGLAFLSKKSWHTKNLANQEKVWMAEERKQAEERKTKELAQQIAQEREREELDKIAGKSSRLDRGIDWMYQEGGGAALAKEVEGKKNEEYLLGKEYVPEGSKVGDFANLDEGGVNKILSSVPSTAAVLSEASGLETTHASAASIADVPPPAAAVHSSELTVADRNEAFRMRHEDPMFAVSLKQHKQQSAHDKKRALYERVVGPTADKASIKEDEKRSKKERKREKKRRRRDSQKEEDRHSDRLRRRHRSRSRSRSSSRDRDECNKRRHESRYRSRSESEERHRRRSPGSPDRDEDHHRRHSRHEHSLSRERSRRHGSRSHSPRDRLRDHDHRRQHHHHRHEDERKSSPYHHHHNEQSRPSSRPEGYGLQGSSSGAPSRSQDQDLGPNRELLEQKRQQREEERRRMMDTASSRRNRTEQERAAALEEMRRDASKRDQLLHQAVASKSNHHDDEHSPSSADKKASFLQDMAEQTHGIRNDGGGSLASRVAQRRHTNQNLNEKFL